MGKIGNKISSKIVLAVLIISIIMSVIVGGTSILRSKSVIEKEARNNLESTQQVYADKVNEQVIVYERTLKDINQFVSGSIETSRLGEENYLENYSNGVLNPILTGIESELNLSGGLYVIFDHKYTGRTE